MRKTIILSIILIAFLLGCATSARSGTFNPDNISQEMYQSTMDDVQQYINGLNRIISSGNYQAWVNNLSAEYFQEISSPEFLAAISENPGLRMQNITLRSASDYFTHVVMPSRANSKVDDIEFTTENRIKVFSMQTNRAGEEVRLRLYDLEKTGDTWKIIN